MDTAEKIAIPLLHTAYTSSPDYKRARQNAKQQHSNSNMKVSAILLASVSAAHAFVFPWNSTRFNESLPFPYVGSGAEEDLGFWLKAPKDIKSTAQFNVTLQRKGEWVASNYTDVFLVATEYEEKLGEWFNVTAVDGVFPVEFPFWPEQVAAFNVSGFVVAVNQTGFEAYQPVGPVLVEWKSPNGFTKRTKGKWVTKNEPGKPWTTVPWTPKPTEAPKKNWTEPARPSKSVESKEVKPTKSVESKDVKPTKSEGTKATKTDAPKLSTTSKASWATTHAKTGATPTAVAPKTSTTTDAKKTNTATTTTATAAKPTTTPAKTTTAAPTTKAQTTTTKPAATTTKKNDPSPFF